jgi:hypothetical protein
MWFGDRSLLQIFLRGTWDACVCRKLDSTILVMKSAEDGLRIDDARGAQRLMKRGILVQGSMNARFIIIDDILAQDATQMSCPKYDHVVETFPSERADQSFGVRILPPRARANGLGAIHSAVGCPVTLIQTSSRRASRTMTRT